MVSGAPEPSLHVSEDRLFVAYNCINPAFPGWDSGASPDHPGFDDLFAILEFTGVRSHTLGEPSEETLANHPLFQLGVSWYGFYRLAIPDEETEWIIAFHDNTLRVRAESARVVFGPATSEQPTPREVLEDYLKARSEG